eukprot:6192642-Pleurochrysis_carterae.AAC.1
MTTGLCQEDGRMGNTRMWGSRIGANWRNLELMEEFQWKGVGDRSVDGQLQRPVAVRHPLRQGGLAAHALLQDQRAHLRAALVR